MISSGYFKVTKGMLRCMTKTEAYEFISEMYNYGGRISHSQFQLWLDWIKNNL